VRRAALPGCLTGYYRRGRPAAVPTGDFGGSAERSRSTAQTLRAIEAQLAGAQGDLARSADLFEQSARAMLADLDEWRLVNQQQELSVG
jgi:hypothetical protein